MPDYDFYHGLYTGQQVDSAVARALVGGQLDQDIAAIRAAVGSPLVANTAAEMTNINKIYVYTGSEAGYSTGHWYYYESGWQDGGLYNSAAADSAMSDSSTNAVQNKVIKEYVDTTASGLSGDITDVRTDLGADILAEQTRAEGVEALKAPLASPAFTGTPTAPTAAAGTANTQIATTAYADNAVAVETARAEGVEATKADKSYADYILLREEEDRQILFGSIVQAAEDAYDELRAAPIHNSITIGGSVYPRMDRTRMAIDAIRGRTVAFNQLQYNGNFASNDGWTGGTVSDGKIAVSSAAGAYNWAYNSQRANIIEGHKYLVFADYKAVSGFTTGTALFILRVNGSGSDNNAVWAQGNVSDGSTHQLAAIFTATSHHAGNSILFWGTYDSENATSAEWSNLIVRDITAQYNGAIDSYSDADAIAYVRQRMDLTYYAYNAGTLTAPVVSGVSFTGFNQWDEEWEVGAYDITTGAKVTNNSYMRSKNYIHVLPSTTYYRGSGNLQDCHVLYYDASKAYISQVTVSTAGTFTTPSNAAFITFFKYGATYANNICINISSSMNGTYKPYDASAWATLSLPSTTLNGVGTAQDVLECIEVGENDYSLVKTSVIGTVEFDGGETWTRDDNKKYFISPASVVSNAKQTNWWSASFANTAICKYNGVTYTDMDNGSYGFTFANGAVRVKVAACDDMTEAQFETWLSSNPLTIAYELATPSQTVIAEHLTLAQISAIAENGGIISIVSDTGHIVQPDVVMDTVISRSAS